MFLDHSHHHDLDAHFRDSADRGRFLPARLHGFTVGQKPHRHRDVCGVCATDWLDGYLARKLNQTSSFGAFLDPVADKFLVCACVLVLVHLQRADVFVGLIIIGREIAISALREWMAQIGASKSVAVHMIGKLKTVAQMVAIPFLLFDGMLLGAINTHLWGVWLIWAAAVLTIWSMVYYLQKALPEIRARAK
jgi:cardiolipin synthase